MGDGIKFIEENGTNYIISQKANKFYAFVSVEIDESELKKHIKQRQQIR